MRKFQKAILPNKVYKNNNYRKSTYGGISKYLYFFNHYLLDLNVNEKYNEHIVEIGGGAHQHLHYMSKKNIKTYTIIDSKVFYKDIVKLRSKFKGIRINFIDYKKINLNKLKFKFTRLISSHTFEHFDNFETQFLNLLKIMKKDSLISIALPCDPGIMWRILQYFSYFNQRKFYGWKTFKEKDLDDSRDHLVSAQNILKVLRYYFSDCKSYFFPFIIPVIEFNIFLILRIKTASFHKKN